MRKRLSLLTGIMVGIAVAAFGVARWLAPAHRITPVAYKEIRPGMTLSEVEAVLSVPPGDYPPGRVRNDSPWIEPIAGPPAGTPEVWRTETTVIAVFFDRGGHVSSRFSSSVLVPSWLDRVRHFLHL